MLDQRHPNTTRLEYHFVSSADPGEVALTALSHMSARFPNVQIIWHVVN